MRTCGLERVFYGQEVEGVTYEIEVSNPDGVMKGVKERYLDGKKVERIPLMEKGTVHQVRVVMGKEGNAND